MHTVPCCGHLCSASCPGPRQVEQPPAWHRGIAAGACRALTGGGGSALGFSQLVGAFSMSLPSFCPILVSTPQAERLLQETRGLGSDSSLSPGAFFFLTDLPEKAVSPCSASGSKGKAAVGSWLSRVQVQQAQECMGWWGGWGVTGLSTEPGGRGTAGKDCRSCCSLAQGGQRVYVSSRWAGKGRAVRAGGGYICWCGGDGGTQPHIRGSRAADSSQVGDACEAQP